MASPRILVVEDERIVAAGLRKRLGQLGYDVPVVACSGEEAVRLAGELLPDLVLMDIQLEGEMDGVQAAEQVRRLGLPVVYLTAYSNHEVLDRAKVTEPYGYILKPYEDRELHVVVETALYKHRIERALHERERWQSAVLDSIGDAVVTTDDQGRITFLNPTAERLTGWRDGEARGRPLEEVLTLLHQQTRQPVEAPLRQAVREGAKVPLANHTVLVSRTGEERPVDDSATPILDGGLPLGGAMVFRDVSERYRAEQASARLAAIVQSAEDAIIGTTAEGVITSWNDGAERLYGFAPEEVQGWPLAVLFPEGHRDELRRLLERVRGGERLGAFETAGRQKDAKVVEVMMSISPVLDPEGRVTGAAAIAHDVTVARRLEHQVRHAQKMEAIGRLAGGVAHDFNNLLAVINGFTEVLLRLLPDNPRAVEHLEQILRAGERAAALTRQLLAYSRKQVLQPKVLDLNEVVEGARMMLGRVIGEDVELAAVPAPDLWRVRADPGQMDQVLMNLCVNARDAMPRGGKITLETRNVELDAAASADLFDVRPGRYVLLAVADAGAGMDEATKSHLFEPFFTTKGEGKGTGLGLATVFGIVKQTGGYVKVYSEVGHGTTFKVYLPAVEEAGGAPRPGEAPGGTETVLLVEDEEGVRALARRLLQRGGYTVLDAADGPEALEVVSRHPMRIDLLVTDVVLPHMSGRQVAEALRQQRPDLKVLYVSGYTDDAVVRHGVLEPSAAFLQKPFSMSDFGRKVREILDRRG
jgi:PAS domain S-box-containing protein